MEQETKTAKIYGPDGRVILTLKNVASSHGFPGGCYLTLVDGSKVDVLGGMVVVKTLPPKKKK